MEVKEVRLSLNIDVHDFNTKNYTLIIFMFRPGVSPCPHTITTILIQFLKSWRRRVRVAAEIMSVLFVIHQAA